MKKLSRSELLEAAERLRAAAEGEFILPETYGVERKALPAARRDYFFPVADRYVRFMLEVELDSSSACLGALERLPFKFKGEVVTLGDNVSSQLLDASELNVLIMAFLLAVNLPMHPGEAADGGGERLLIGVAPTIALDCGEASAGSGGPSGADASHRMLNRLYELSKEFFNSEVEGLEFWAFRIAKSMRNRAAAAVEGDGNGVIDWGVSSEEAGLPLSVAIASRHLKFSEIDSQKTGQTGTLIEVPRVEGEKMSTALGRRPPERKSPKVLAMAAAVLSVVALVATHMYGGLFPRSSPQIASIDRRASARVISPETDSASDKQEDLYVGKQVEADENAASAVSVKPVAQETLFRPPGDPSASESSKTESGLSAASAGDVSQHAIDAGAESKFSGSNVAPANSSAGAASGEPRGGKENSAAGASGKVKSSPPHVARSRSVAVSKRTQQNNSLTVISRTVDGFAKQFAKDLRRLPGQISSIFSH